MRRDAPEVFGLLNSPKNKSEETVTNHEASDIVFNLKEAARLIESSAISLAGEVAGGQVTHLMLMSQQLDRISRALEK